jgi:TatD DNase family protein
MITDIHTHNDHTHAQTIKAEGVHPWHALEGDLSAVESKIESIDAIGEIGLDFACNTPREVQMDVFRAQLALAEQHKKPIVLHCVKAFEEIMKILSEYHLQAVIFHCFIGSVEQAQRAISEGYYLSFGERTLRSSKTIEALRHTPLSQFFIETDESPMPIEEIYEKIAHLLDISTTELAQITEENFRRIFNF